MCPPRFSPLCGDDEYTGKNYDHRKSWIVKRLAFLGAVFAIDVCFYAYAVLSTHFHVVLRVMAHLVQRWSDEEVLRPVGRLCPSTVKGVGVAAPAFHQSVARAALEHQLARYLELRSPAGQVPQVVVEQREDGEGVLVHRKAPSKSYVKRSLRLPVVLIKKSRPWPSAPATGSDSTLVVVLGTGGPDEKQPPVPQVWPQCSRASRGASPR